jgi:WD40 repeat protein
MRDFDRALVAMGAAPPMAREASGGAGGRGGSESVVSWDASIGAHVRAGSAAGAGWRGSPAAWVRGPVEASGRHVDLSERPLLCAAVSPSGGEVAVGGSDHAVSVVDLARGKVSRTLYTKRFGHTEWVTCVAYAGDGSGRLVSGAMDAKVCVWASTGVSCVELVGHAGSVSDVVCVGGVAVTAGYDKSVRVWGLDSGGELARLVGHTAPVLCLALGDTHLVSGGREGAAVAWDLTRGARVGRMAGHEGHVTAVAALSGAGANEAASVGADAALFATGGQDGHVRVWDVRGKRAVANVAAHTTPEGAGAVGDIVYAAGNGGDLTAGNVLVSAGADAAVCVLDPRRGFQVRARFEEHRDFIYSLAVAGRCVLSGAGDGSVYAHDLATDAPIWGLGANKAAVRALLVADKTLIAAGDDGGVLIYDLDD